MTKTFELSPIEAAVIDLVRHGGSAAIYAAEASTNAEAKKMIAPLLSMPGTKLTHEKSRLGTRWTASNYDNGKLNYAAIDIELRRPDHG